MNQVQVFSYAGNEVRTVQRNAETWWVLKDVCNILEIGNSRDVTARLDSDEKGVDSIDTLGGNQEVTIISESGLYNVILLSRKPEAKKFKRWVTHEVLPTIRKHGVYMTPEKIEEVLLNPDTIITLATQLKTEREQRLLAEQQVEEMKPLAEFADHVSNTKDLIDVGRMAKLLHDEHIDIGRNKLFQWLRDNKILMKNNTPYQSYVDGGYFKVRESTQETAYGPKIYTTTFVTGKGQIYITERLRKEFVGVAS